MKKILRIILIAPIFLLITMFILALIQSKPLWKINYVGMSQEEIIKQIGPNDTGDFSGLYWCNGYKLFGHKLSTAALFLPLDSSLHVTSQKIISFPEVMICWH